MIKFANILHKQIWGKVSKQIFFSKKIEKRHNYTNKALQIVLQYENDSLNRLNLFKVANRYYNTNSLKEYCKTVNLVLEN